MVGITAIVLSSENRDEETVSLILMRQLRFRTSARQAIGMKHPSYYSTTSIEKCLTLGRAS
jgi:hypothetical protein